MHFTTTLATLLAAVSAVDIPSFAPPEFPITTIENDGTNVGRYDVRKTMAWLDPGTGNLNSYFFLMWLTLRDGRKYHVTVAPNFRLDSTTGIFVLNDLQNLEQEAASGTAFAPGEGREGQVFLQSAIQNFSSPAGGDNYTDMYYNCDFAGVNIDVHFTPTGKNIYVGGSGGVTIAANEESGNDYRRLIPGYSWYWGNPTLRVDGKIMIDGTYVEIDTTQSIGFFERQTGTFGIPGGHLGFWLYLSNGIMVHCWQLAPTKDGTLSNRAWATIWHSSGLHEVVEISSNTSRAANPYVSVKSGLTYFRSFFLDVPTRNATFNIEQSATHSEASPAAGYPGYNITEAYGQGSGTWDGEDVTFFGHVEQLSFI
ncbi:hypothetical protein F5883DRAFT_668053 [Diaporthe sp. PMI_573]|nr:hypothetical protein F5883DRAFT_668053 [Diaporthaceae sp. PMI_573]